MVKTLASELRPMLDGQVVTAALFGSFARGRATAGSDIDLLVIVETLKERERIGALLADRLLVVTERYGLPIQPVIYERRRLNNEEGLQELIETAEREGVTVAGADIKQLRRALTSPKVASRRRSA
jgi:predicted nucleotidyltransferase